MFLNRLQQIAFDASREFIDTSPSREVCFHWLRQDVKDAGVTQHHLRQLADLGYLSKVDTVRGGSRVYYKLGPLACRIGRGMATAGKA